MLVQYPDILVHRAVEAPLRWEIFLHASAIAADIWARHILCLAGLAILIVRVACPPIGHHFNIDKVDK